MLTGVGLFLQLRGTSPGVAPRPDSGVSPPRSVPEPAPQQSHHDLMQQAYDLAGQGNFSEAIRVAQRIPASSPCLRHLAHALESQPG